MTPNILYHGSMYNTSVLQPGYNHTKVEIHWDSTESNKFLYATTDQDMAIALGLASAIEKHHSLESFSYKNNTLEISVSSKSPKLDISDIQRLSVYLYKIDVRNSDGWQKNNNPSNSLDTEYKTNKKVSSISSMEKVDVAEWLGRKKVKMTHKKLAVIITGNPKYIDDPRVKPMADHFYNDLKTRLEGYGYIVEFDRGEEYTQPTADAVLWVGHSRGIDRLRFAPPNVVTYALQTKDAKKQYGNDQASRDKRGHDRDHYILSAEDIKALKEIAKGNVKPVAATTVTRVFLIKSGRIYLMLRNGLHGGYTTVVRRWIAPGGKVDAGETPEQGAVRECKEELDIDINPSDLTLILEKHDPTFDANMIFYTCTKWHGEIKTMEPEKFDRTAWVGIEEVSATDGMAGAHLGVFIKEAAALLGKKKPIYAKW